MTQISCAHDRKPRLATTDIQITNASVKYCNKARLKITSCIYSMHGDLLSVFVSATKDRQARFFQPTHKSHKN